jgi:cation transport ATPase
MKATVGIAMGAGADVARGSANVVLIGNDLSKLVDTLGIARRCHRTIMQTLSEQWWSTALALAWQRLAFSIRFSPHSFTFLRKWLLF